MFKNINDTHREKLFYSVQYKEWLAASDPFRMFTQSIKHLHSITRIKSAGVWKM